MELKLVVDACATWPSLPPSPCAPLMSPPLGTAGWLTRPLRVRTLVGLLRIIDSVARPCPTSEEVIVSLAHYAVRHKQLDHQCAGAGREKPGADAPRHGDAACA